MQENNLSDIAAERAVHAAIVKYGKEAFLECDDLLAQTSFSSHLNQVLYIIFKHLYDKNIDKKIDFPTIASAAKEVGLYKEIEEKREIDYILSLFNYNVELDNVREFCVKLLKLEKVRDLLCKVDDTAKAIRSITGDETLEEIVSIAESPIFEFSNKLMSGNSQLESFGEGLVEYLDNKTEDMDKGISICFPKFEEAIGYLTHGIHVVGAEMKTGKSYHANNAVLNAAGKNKVTTLLLDTELNKDQGVWDRSLARITKIDVNDIRFGAYKKNPEDEIQINKAARMLVKMPITYQNVNGKNFSEVISIIRRWLIMKVGYNKQGKLNPCLVVYDYIKLLDHNDIKKNIAEHQQLGQMMASLHDLSSQYNFPVLTYAQLNRDGDIASSMRIQWFCSSYSVMSKKTEGEIGEDGPANGNLKIQPLYCRFGAGLSPGDFINYSFSGQYGMIQELDTRNNIARRRLNDQVE